MGRTVGDLVFIPGANSNPETDGGRESTGYFFGKDANATGVVSVALNALKVYFDGL